MLRLQRKQKKNWDDVPEDVKNTFDKLGIPEAEKEILGGCRCSIRIRSSLS